VTQNYERLVDLFVKPDLRDEIKSLKKEQTYDQFLRELIENYKNSGSHPSRDKKTPTKDNQSREVLP